MSGKRFQPYKEDSTKGGSKVIPKNYKNDVMVQVWMESRKLATLSKWLEKEGRSPRFLSEVVRDPIDILVNYLVELGEIEMVDDTTVAREMLSRRYRVQLNVDEKGMRNAEHNIHLTEQRKERKEERKIERDMERIRDIERIRKLRENREVREFKEDIDKDRFIRKDEIRGNWSEEDVEYYYGEWIVKGWTKVLMFIVEGRVKNRDFKSLMYELRTYLREKGVEGIPFILGMRRISL